MNYAVSNESASSTVAFFDSMREKLRVLMGNTVAAPVRAREVYIDDDVVRALVADGRRLSGLCAHFRCSEVPMRAVLYRLGLLARGMHGRRGSKRTKERRAEGMRMLAAGATITEVARTMGVTKPSVIGWRRKMSEEAKGVAG